jgi:hypothetical protein
MHPVDSDPVPLAEYAKEETFHDAAALLAVLGSKRFSLGRWVFRGQTNATWGLQPTLERFARSISALNRSPLDRSAAIEESTIREFQRHAHHYAQNLPEHENRLEWLALMRHHGSPSRLLDFSKSPYVAAFFATADAEPSESAAIWAIDIFALRNLAAVSLSKEMVAPFREAGARCLADATFSFSDPAVFARLTSITTGPFPSVIIPVEPFRTSDRMLLQQSLFLCNLSPFETFGASLKSMLREAKAAPGAPDVLYKLVIHRTVHPSVLRELHRMNVSYTSLLPGLDGFARSLATLSKIRYATGDPEFGMKL